MDYLFSNTTVIVSHESRDKGSRHIPPPYKEFSFMHICMYVRTLFIYMYFSSPILHICIRLWIVSLLLLDAIDDMTGLLISFLIGCSLLVTSPHYSLTQHILPSVCLCISATYLHTEITILLFCRSKTIIKSSAVINYRALKETDQQILLCIFIHISMYNFFQIWLILPLTKINPSQSYRG